MNIIYLLVTWCSNTTSRSRTKEEEMNINYGIHGHEA